MSFSIPQTYQPTEAEISTALANVMQKVYTWMGVGLALTALVSWLVSGTEWGVNFLIAIAGNPLLFFGILIGELIFVSYLSIRVYKLSPPVALGMFFLYAAWNGITLSFIFLAYTLSSITVAFVATAALFAVMSFIGYTTKQDLSSWGKYLMIGLVAFIIGSVANFFLASSGLDWLLTYAGLAIFLGLTIYQTQRIKQVTVGLLSIGQAHLLSNVGVWGALALYLDFINIFLMLLRIFGRRR